MQVKADVKDKFYLLTSVFCQRHVHVATNGKQPPVEHAWRVTYLCWILIRLRTWMSREWIDFTNQNKTPILLTHWISQVSRSILNFLAFWWFGANVCHVLLSFLFCYFLDFSLYLFWTINPLSWLWARVLNVDGIVVPVKWNLNFSPVLLSLKWEHALKLQNWNCWIAFETKLLLSKDR